MVILPRQARDKKQHSKKDYRFVLLLLQVALQEEVAMLLAKNDELHRRLIR
jgi:hypothetical protein